MIYGTDLAHVHHVGFGDLARAAARVLASELRKADLPSRRVVDLGCGSGILAAALLDSGFAAVGVDISPSMIAEARRQAPEATFHLASLHELAIPECAAVSAVGEAVSYLDRGEDGVDLVPLLGRAGQAIVPGGLLLFDVIESTRTDPMSYLTTQSGPDWEVTAEVGEDLARGIITRAITTRRSADQATRATREVHRVQTFRREDLERTLDGLGFEVEIRQAYGDVPLPPRRICVLARKPTR